MWTRSHSITTKEVTKEQMWKLFTDVNNWHKWDTGIDYTKMEGKFEKGNLIELKPKKGPKAKIELIEVIENKKFLSVSKFPLAEMYFDHLLEETVDGLKITQTITMNGLLGFLWVKIVAQDIVNNLPMGMQEQVKYASKL